MRISILLVAVMLQGCDHSAVSLHRGGQFDSSNSPSAILTNIVILLQGQGAICTVSNTGPSAAVIDFRSGPDNCEFYLDWSERFTTGCTGGMYWWMMNGRGENQYFPRRPHLRNIAERVAKRLQAEPNKAARPNVSPAAGSP